MPPLFGRVACRDEMQYAAPAHLTVNDSHRTDRLHSYEFRQATARQIPRASSIHSRSVAIAPDVLPFIPEPDYDDTVASLHASIQQRLNTLKAEWKITREACSSDVSRTHLTGRYSEVVALARTRENLVIDDSLGIDAILSKHMAAIEKLMTASVKPTRMKRDAIGAQVLISDPGQRTKKANALVDTLHHLDAALLLITRTLTARREVEDGRRAFMDIGISHDERERLRAEWRDAAHVTCALLNEIVPEINSALKLASAAVPKERQRTKKRILLATLAVAVGLLVTISFVVIPAVPATIAGLVILGKVLLAIAGATTSLSFGIYAVIGYNRNRGWALMASEIEDVKNMHNAITAGFEAKNTLLHASQIVDLEGHLDFAHLRIGKTKRVQATLDKRVDQILTSLEMPALLL